MRHKTGGAISAPPKSVLNSTLRGLDFGFISREASLCIGVLRDTVFSIGGVLLHDAFELSIEGFCSLIAAGHRIFRAAMLVHDFDVGQPKGGRIFHHDVALLIERKLSLWCIVGAWLDLGIRVRIGEIERPDFAAILTAVKIILRKNLVQFFVSQFDDLIVFFFGFTSSSLLRFGSLLFKIIVGVAKQTNTVNGQDERLRRH